LPERDLAWWLPSAAVDSCGVAPPCLQALQSVASAFLEDEELPNALRPAIVEHMMLVHQSVRHFSARFAEELRRHNYVTVSVEAAATTLLFMQAIPPRPDCIKRLPCCRAGNACCSDDAASRPGKACRNMCSAAAAQ
jgi:hypothetical protein